MELTKLVKDLAEQSVPVPTALAEQLCIAALERKDWELVSTLVTAGLVPAHLLERIGQVSDSSAQKALAGHNLQFAKAAGVRLRASVWDSCTSEVAREIFLGYLEDPKISLERKILKGAQDPVTFATPEEAFQFLTTLSKRTEQNSWGSWVLALGRELTEKLVRTPTADWSLRKDIVVNYDIPLHLKVETLREAWHARNLQGYTVLLTVRRIPHEKREWFVRELAKGCAKCTEDKNCGSGIKVDLSDILLRQYIPPAHWEGVQTPSGRERLRNLTAAELLAAPPAEQEYLVEHRLMPLVWDKETTRDEVLALLELTKGIDYQKRKGLFLSTDPFARFAGDDEVLDYWRANDPIRSLRKHGWGAFGTCCDFMKFDFAKFNAPDPLVVDPEDVGMLRPSQFWTTAELLHPCRHALPRAPLFWVSREGQHRGWKQMFIEYLAETLGNNPDQWALLWLLEFNATNTVEEALNTITAVASTT